MEEARELASLEDVAFESRFSSGLYETSGSFSSCSLGTSCEGVSLREQVGRALRKESPDWVLGLREVPPILGWVFTPPLSHPLLLRHPRQLMSQNRNCSRSRKDECNGNGEVWNRS